MQTLFKDSGCQHCRTAWTAASGTDDVLVQIGGINFERQARLYVCKHCGGYWEEPNGNYPCGISMDDVRQFYGISPAAN